ncbi:hypothetical protein CN216_31880, partial [Sinorhizobium meliloti]
RGRHHLGIRGRLFLGIGGRDHFGIRGRIASEFASWFGRKTAFGATAKVVEGLRLFTPLQEITPAERHPVVGKPNRPSAELRTPNALPSNQSAALSPQRSLYPTASPMILAPGGHVSVRMHRSKEQVA